MDNVCSTPIFGNCVKLGSLSLSDINSNSAMKPKAKARSLKQILKGFKCKSKSIKLPTSSKRHASSSSSWETDLEEFTSVGTNDEETPKKQKYPKLKEYFYTSDEFPSPEYVRDARAVVDDLNLSLCTSPPVYATPFEKNYESDCELLPTENVPLLSVGDPIESQSLEGSIVIDREKLINCKTYPPPLKRKKVPSKGLHRQACTSQKIDYEKFPLEDNLRNDFEIRKQGENVPNERFSLIFSTHRANQLWEDFMKGQKNVPESQHAVDVFESSAATAKTFSDTRGSKQVRTFKRLIRNRNLGENDQQKCKNKRRKIIKSPPDDMTYISRSLSSVNNLYNKPARDRLEIFEVSDSDSDDSKQNEKSLVLVNKMCDIRKNYNNIRLSNTDNQENNNIDGIVPKKQRNKLKSWNEVRSRNVSMKQNLTNTDHSLKSESNLIFSKYRTSTEESKCGSWKYNNPKKFYQPISTVASRANESQAKATKNHKRHQTQEISRLRLINEKENYTLPATVTSVKRPRLVSIQKLVSTRYILMKNTL